MDDRFTKFSKLYILIFLLFLSFPVFIGLGIGFFYGFFSLVSSKPLDIFLELFVIAIPPAIFSSVYFIFIKRTKYHPSPLVKIISQTIFVIGLMFCIYTLAINFWDYYKTGRHNITTYTTFSLPFLAGNIGTLFIIAIIQAFTTNKEEDWLEKRKKKTI